MSEKTHRRFVFKLLSNVMKHASDTNLSAGLGRLFYKYLQTLFPLSLFGKIAFCCYRSIMQTWRAFSLQHVLFTLANLPATGCTLQRWPLTILQPLPLRYIVSVCQFCLCYSSELRCKGTNLFAIHQTKNQKSLYF